VTLRERGIASSSEYDVAVADRMEKEAQVEVAEAQVNRATAALESSRIRFGYTRVTADWNEGDAVRIVAERYVDEGTTVSANEPLLRIVQLDPIVAVISVTTAITDDYVTDWKLSLQRMPFRESYSRSYRADCAGLPRDKPTSAGGTAWPIPKGGSAGMFIRAVIELDRVNTLWSSGSGPDKRGYGGGVLVDASGGLVTWAPVETGIRSRGWVQVTKPSLSGRVVTMGQHLIDHGSPVRVVAMFGSDSAQ